VLYLHGFPDLSIVPSSGAFASRFSRKLCEAVLSRQAVDGGAVLFACFNASGLPGSDSVVPFKDKLLSREVEEVVTVAQWLRGPGAGAREVHVVGISTGAILAACVRDRPEITSVATIAGLLDVVSGADLDFDVEQRAAFDSLGYCMKEFWVPDIPAPVSPPRARLQLHPTRRFTVLEPCDSEPAAPVPAIFLGTWSPLPPESTKSQTSTKVALQLGRQYYDDMRALPLLRAVQEGFAPLLVVHGDADRAVPVQCGHALHEAAREPKRLEVVRKANHLFTSTAHMKKVSGVVSDWVAHHWRLELLESGQVQEPKPTKKKSVHKNQNK